MVQRKLSRVLIITRYAMEITSAVLFKFLAMLECLSCYCGWYMQNARSVFPIAWVCIEDLWYESYDKKPRFYLYIFVYCKWSIFGGGKGLGECQSTCIFEEQDSQYWQQWSLNSLACKGTVHSRPGQHIQSNLTVQEPILWKETKTHLFEAENLMLSNVQFWRRLYPFINYNPE